MTSKKLKKVQKLSQQFNYLQFKNVFVTPLMQ